MKKVDAIKLIENGTLAIIGEYRGSKAEAINYVDKTSGRAATMKTLKHSIEVGDQAIAFNERVPDTFVVDTYKSPYNKGQKVLVYLSSLQNDKGVVRASGKLDVITD